MRPLVVVSFYDRRDNAPLQQLLDSMQRHPAGIEHDVVVCINASGAEPLPMTVRARVHGVLERPNLGMNIGAWDAGWRRWPGRPFYLFLQDECHAVNDGWLAMTQAALDAPGIGMVGESFNSGWDRAWDELREGPGATALPEHFVGDRPAGRVETYLHHMRRYGIDPGAGGRHLRSLAWALRSDTLESIGGFPQGTNYGECIAAEIGVSRAVEARGLGLRTVGPAPFHAFRHLEWSQDVPGGAYTQKSPVQRELKRLRQENALLRERVDNPRMADVWRGWRRRLRERSAG